MELQVVKFRSILELDLIKALEMFKEFKFTGKKSGSIVRAS